MDHVSRFGVWSADQEIVRFDIAVDEIFLVYGLYPGQLKDLISLQSEKADLVVFTICFATMTTVLGENLLLQMSKRSSRDGPRRSMTRML